MNNQHTDETFEEGKLILFSIFTHHMAEIITEYVEAHGAEAGEFVNIGSEVTVLLTELKLLDIKIVEGHNLSRLSMAGFRFLVDYSTYAKRDDVDDFVKFVGGLVETIIAFYMQPDGGSNAQKLH